MRRYLKAAMKKLLSKKEREELLKQALVEVIRLKDDIKEGIKHKGNEFMSDSDTEENEIRKEPPINVSIVASNLSEHPLGELNY